MKKYSVIKTVALACIIAFALALPNIADAQQAPRAPAGDNQQKRIVRPMIAINANTLQAEGMQIRLWGIKPARSLETAIELRALDHMDRLIGQGQVNCRIMKWSLTEPAARCNVATNEDLNLEMLRNGFAVVDRAETYNTVFATAYHEAQEQARLQQKGIWKLVVEQEQTSFIPDWLEPHMPSLVPLSLVVGPAFGFLLLAFFVWKGFRNIEKVQEREFETNRRKEAALLAREKLVLATSLEGELMENKSKIEAFLTIYQELLNDLKNPESTPKYQDAGDLIHEHPALSRTVFEMNVDKFSLLDLKLASDLSKLYTQIKSESKYQNMDPTMPLADATEMVEKVIHDAEALLPHIDYIIEQLHGLTAKYTASAGGRKRAAEANKQAAEEAESADYDEAA